MLFMLTGRQGCGKAVHVYQPVLRREEKYILWGCSVQAPQMTLQNIPGIVVMPLVSGPSVMSPPVLS